MYCQVGKASQGKFALEVAVKTLGLYKEYVVCFTCAVTTRFLANISMGLTVNEFVDLVFLIYNPGTLMYHILFLNWT